VTPTSHKCDICVAFQFLAPNFKILQADQMLSVALYMCMIAMVHRLHDACANSSGAAEEGGAQEQQLHCRR
jgi:hypothetical protein